MANGSNPGNEKVENDPRVWTDRQEYHADTDHQGNDINNVGATSVERVNNAHVYASGLGDDGAACQAALDEHGSSPSTVHLDVEVTALGAAAPLEIPSNTRVLIESDITLAASTAENILQSKDAFTQATGTGSSTVRSNIHVEGAGGSLDGNKANQTSGTDGFSQTCVHLYADRSSIRGTQVEGARHHNLSVVGGTADIVVKDNHASDAGLSNIQVHYRSTGGDDGDGALVENVKIVDNTCVGGNNTGSIRLAGCINTSVSGNTVRDHITESYNHGIRIYQGDYPAGAGRDITVTNNVIENVNGNGIQVDSTRLSTAVASYGDHTIRGNHVNGADLDGVFIRCRNKSIYHVVVSDNNIHNCGSNGIRAEKSAWSIAGLVVANNVITTNASAAVAPDGDENVYDGNVARGNGTNAISGTGTNSVVGDNIGL